MSWLASNIGEAFRGFVAIGLIASAIGVVAPTSLPTAGFMVLAAVTLAASGRGGPQFRNRQNG